MVSYTISFEKSTKNKNLYTKIFKINTPSSPMTDTRVSMTDQVSKVSLILRLKYCLKSQKPPSFKCDNIRLPEPIASTINSGLMSVYWAIMGAKIPTAVSPATVAEPTQTLISPAIAQPKMSGEIVKFCNKDPT